jgi:type II secretion system protein N
LKKFLLAIVAVITLVWGLWVAFPVTVMESMIEDSVQNRNIILDVQGLQKGFFYRLYADKIVLKKAASGLIALNSVHATINPLHLVLMRMNFSAHGRLGEGTFSGHASIAKNMAAMDFGFVDTGVTDIPFLSAVGIRGKGRISGSLTMNDQTGHLQFLVKDAELEPVIFQGVPAPLNFFRSVNGSVDIEGSIVHLQSVSLEGADIAARLKGMINDGVMDIRMEVMPRKPLLENPLFLSQIDRYQVSPGYYVIPIKGPLLF